MRCDGESQSICPAPSRAVWLALCIVLWIAVCNSSIVLTGTPGWLHGALAANYNLVREGRLWLIFTSWIAHADRTHLFTDLAYLISLGILLNRLMSAAQFAWVFFLGCVIGTAIACSFDKTYAGSCGSSDGSHGLLAYYCIRKFIHCRHDCWRIVYAGSIVYLFYNAFVGLLTGYSAVGFPNSGWSHLGGISIGLLIGCLSEVIGRYRRSWLSQHRTQAQVVWNVDDG